MFKLAMARPEGEAALCLQPTIARLGTLPGTRAAANGGAVVDLYCASLHRVPGGIVLHVDDTFDVVHGRQHMRLFNARRPVPHPAAAHDQSGRGHRRDKALGQTAPTQQRIVPAHPGSRSRPYATHHQLSCGAACPAVNHFYNPQRRRIEPPISQFQNDHLPAGPHNRHATSARLKRGQLQCRELLRLVTFAA